MRKLLCLLLSVLILSSCAESNVPKDKVNSQFKTGMTRDDVLSLDAACFCYREYIFCKSDGENNVVCKVNSDTSLVEEVMEFPPAEPKKEAFSAICEGMTVTDVVKTVGLPFRTATFGLSTLDFQADDGTVYRIQWDEDMKVIDMTEIPDTSPCQNDVT